MSRLLLSGYSRLFSRGLGRTGREANSFTYSFMSCRSTDFASLYFRHIFAERVLRLSLQTVQNSHPNQNTRVGNIPMKYFSSLNKMLIAMIYVLTGSREAFRCTYTHSLGQQITEDTIKTGFELLH